MRFGGVYCIRKSYGDKINKVLCILCDPKRQSFCSLQSICPSIEDEWNMTQDNIYEHGQKIESLLEILKLE